MMTMMMMKISPSLRPKTHPSKMTETKNPPNQVTKKPSWHHEPSQVYPNPFPMKLYEQGSHSSHQPLICSLNTLLKSKDTTSALVDEYPSPRRTTTQGPTGMETLSLVNPEDFATRTSITSSRASSSKSRSRLGKKSSSHSKRAARSPSKSRAKDNGAQVYALWTAAITAGFLVGFGAGYAWKEYLAGGGGGEDIKRVGCSWCGEGKR